MLRKCHALLLFCLVAAVPVMATHISGGEIYYDCLGGNQYRITLVVYRDCAGINLDASYQLDIESPCGDTSVTVTTPGGTEISQLCQAQIGNSTCNGGTLPGIQQFIYTGTITLPPCNSWTVSWSDNWRNGAIANLVNPGNKDEYVEAKINNLGGPCDDSPQFTNTAIPYVCAGYPISYSYGAFDPEGDSLTYTFINAMNTGGVDLPYVTGYSGAEPITGITLDPQSGQVEFTLNQVGNWVVVVRVDQYDSTGAWIGSIMRDMQFIAYPCTNIPPDPASGTVSNLTGDAVQTGPRSVEICESGDFCFDAVITDPNAGDILTITSNIAQNLPGAIVTTSGTNPLTAHICWTGTPGTNGFFPFIITANDGACPIPALQTYVFSIHVLPGISYSGPLITNESCAGNNDGSASVSVDVGMEPFHFQWNTGDTTPEIIAGPGTYTVAITDGNGCQNGPITAVIGAGPPPLEAHAGPDLVVCAGGLPVSLQGTVVNTTDGFWYGGNGSITGTGLSATYMPTAAELAAGGVDLILATAGESPCGTARDTVHIIFMNSFASAAIGSTNLLCNGAATGTASFTPNIPGFSFLWDDPAAQTTATATSLTAGTYSIIVTDTAGCDTTLTATITAPPALSILSLDVMDETCAGSGNGSATATVTGGTAPYHFAWSNGDTTSTITAGAGTYALAVTDANGCTPVLDTAIIQATGQANVADAGADITACFGTYPVALQGSVINATSAVWSGGNGSFTGTGLQQAYMPTQAEILAHGVDLVLTATGNTGCPPDADTVHIALPTSFFGSALSNTSLLCNGDQSGTAQFTPDAQGFNFLWDDPSAQTTATAVNLVAGTYSVHVTDSLGCDTTATVVVAEPPVLNVANIAGTGPLCAGEASGSATATVIGGTPAYAYQWSSNADAQTTETATSLPAGTFTVVVTDANGCQAQATTTLTGPDAISIAAQLADTVCVNTAVPLTALASGGTGAYTISWSGIGTGDSLTYSFPASQVVQVSVVDGNGCQGPVLELPVTVLDLSQAMLHTYGDTAFCPGGTAIVGAFLTGYPGTYNLTWPQIQASGSGPFPIPTDSSLSLLVNATDGCTNSLQDDVQITVETPPAITLPSIIAEGCAPLTVHFPTGLTNQPVTYFWQFGDGESSTSMMPVHVYSAGNYAASLTVTTPLGCTATALNTGQVHAYAPPVAEFGADPWETDADHPQIHFTDQSTGSVSQWNWSFGDGGASSAQHPYFTYLEPGSWQVSLTVTDTHGCTGSIDHEVTITPVYDITIPNAFTPNPNGGSGGSYDPNDLSNDVFYPFVRYVKDFRMRVFNRWGELVFESDDIKRGWDGYYKGQLSPQDVYVYQLWVRFKDNKEMQRMGDLTLFR